MKSKIVRALAAALIIGALFAAGTAPLGPPGTMGLQGIVTGH